MKRTDKHVMKEQVIDILKQFGIRESELTDSTHINRTLGLDSLDSIDLIMRLERTFGIRIPDEDFSRLTTFGGLLHYLKTEQHVDVAVCC